MYKLGVVVGRFQNEPHEGQISVVRAASQNNSLFILIGSAQEQGTIRNPLPYHLRKSMIEDLLDILELNYKPFIFGLADNPNQDQTWSKTIDAMVLDRLEYLRRLTNEPWAPILYHGRDSFAPHYKGRFSLCEVPELPDLSGTSVRNQIMEIDSPDFKKGFLYALTNFTMQEAIIHHSSDFRKGVIYGVKMGRNR